MVRSTPFALCLLAVCLGGAATAQTVTFQGGARDPAPRAFGLRVQTQMQVSLPSVGALSLDEQKTQQESARTALYDMANRECRSLSEVFGGECRLTTLTVNTNMQDRRGTGAESVMATGSATYELARDAVARP